MSESKFKVGDRVRVYGHRTNDWMPFTGTVVQRDYPELNDRSGCTLAVEADAGKVGVFLVHPKQCRKLVKKERRRVWVVFREDYDGVEYTAPAEIGIASRDKARAVEFVEAKGR